MFEQISKLRQEMGPKQLCIGMAKRLLQFVSDVFKLEFAEAPNYGKFKFLLAKTLLGQDVAPDSIFDWSKLPPVVLEHHESQQNQDESNQSIESIDEFSIGNGVECKQSQYFICTKESSKVMKKQNFLIVEEKVALKKTLKGM